jgi:polyphosphate kinase
VVAQKIDDKIMGRKEKTQLGKTQNFEVQQSSAQPKLKRKEYEEQIAKLYVELVKLQFWVKRTGARIIVLFEGRDAAGKGGVIKRITERVSPRVFRVVALPAPSERERSQIYFQRYFEHFPAGGEIVLFDRSWYNRAGVERVMGFCSDEQYDRFLKVCPAWENDIINAGVTLIKYWFEVSKDEQTRRFAERINDLRRSGSLARWIWSRTAVGTIIHERETQCSRPRTPKSHLGMSLRQTTSGELA